MKLTLHAASVKMLRSVLLLLGIFFPLLISARIFQQNDTVPVFTSTRLEALAYIDKIPALEPSPHWPNIKPRLFLKNIRSNIDQPISIYPGNGTNFCGYGALTYLFLKDDPLGYAKLLVQLYLDGKATAGKVVFLPSDAVKNAAGMLKFKGILDIHPAEQMWFLTLAGHYKGYLNIFNRKYDPGDEDRFWASCNYAKFNRMVRQLLHYKAQARGTDLIRPKMDDLYGYIEERIKTGTVVLFINNRIVHKKDHVKIKLAVPTHFIVAEKIIKTDVGITLVYWDYGGKTLMQLSPGFFKQIIYGITYCTKIEPDVN
ncbi:MAG: hypothetical protein ABIR78_13665 [Ferruginibacter sp.]